MAESKVKDIWAELRKPFDPKAVGKLPKVSCGACSKATKEAKSGYDKHCDKHRIVTCADCGAWITEAHIHLDYVGHASVTDRLNNVDPTWTWEPAALDTQGSPALDKDGNLWIKLTVNGVTRYGVGDGKDMKERIGDAIRNAAMRFGVALDLWSKDELESNLEHPENKNIKPSQAGASASASSGSPTAPSGVLSDEQQPAHKASDKQVKLIKDMMRTKLEVKTLGDVKRVIQLVADADTVEDLNVSQASDVTKLLTENSKDKINERLIVHEA